MTPPPGSPHRFRHHPMLGTVVEVRVTGTDIGGARVVDDAVVDTISHLERTFSAFDAGSELERWKRDELDTPSDEFSTVMALALEWQARSGGAFNPMAGALTAAWNSAERIGEPPATALLADVAQSIREPRYRIDAGGVPHRTGDCGRLDLGAFAKGWIVDRALDAAARLASDADIVVNAGGDLAHRGPGTARVAIENPLRPYDNEPPLTAVTIAGVGIATSGRSRRGFRIGDRWFAHVIDPRTGLTADSIASISVVAPDATTADAVATIAGVRPPAEACAEASAYGCACLVIAPDGARSANESWLGIEST